jgi:hypothetical protein
MKIAFEITRHDQAAAPAPKPAKRGNRTRKLLATLIVVGIVGAVAGLGSYSAFTSTTGNSGNSFAAGSVAIGDNDSGTAMLALSNAKPGDTDTSCINLTSTGSLASTVRIYGTVTGTLGSYLTLTITRGTGASGFDNCTGFTADGTDYLGLGNGVIYQGSLASFPANYAGAIVDPKAATPETWTSSENHWYRFVISQDDNNAAQGLSGGASITWEARNQ